MPTYLPDQEPLSVTFDRFQRIRSAIYQRADSWQTALASDTSVEVLIGEHLAQVRGWGVQWPDSSGYTVAWKQAFAAYADTQAVTAPTPNWLAWYDTVRAALVALVAEVATVVNGTATQLTVNGVAGTVTYETVPAANLATLRAAVITLRDATQAV